MSSLTVCLLTYKRTKYALDTLYAAAVHLQCTKHKLRWHIADDGSSPEHRAQLIAWLETRGCEYTLSNAERGGYGRNYNLAMQVAHAQSEFVLPLEDDWQLTRSLDVDDLIDTMAADKRIGCLRMGYLGFTDTLMGTVFKTNNGKHVWLGFDASSPEKHVFAGHPRIEAVWWSRQVGVWPEGLNPGATELEVCGRAASRHYVVWPLDLTSPGPDDLWAHIGSEKSY